MAPNSLESSQTLGSHSCTPTWETLLCFWENSPRRVQHLEASLAATLHQLTHIMNLILVIFWQVSFMCGDTTSFLICLEKIEENIGLQISHQTFFHSLQQTNHSQNLWYYRLQILLHPQQKRMTVVLSVLWYFIASSLCLFILRQTNCCLVMGMEELAYSFVTREIFHTCSVSWMVADRLFMPLGKTVSPGVIGSQVHLCL